MAEIVNLNSLDDEDEDHIKFIDNLKDGAIRATYIVEHKDGTVSVGCNSKELRDMVYDLHQLQEVIRQMIKGVDE